MFREAFENILIVPNGTYRKNSIFFNLPIKIKQFYHCKKGQDLQHNAIVL